MTSTRTVLSHARDSPPQHSTSVMAPRPPSVAYFRCSPRNPNVRCFGLPGGAPLPCLGRAKLLLSRNPSRALSRFPGSRPRRRQLTAHHRICPQLIHHLLPTCETAATGAFQRAQRSSLAGAGRTWLRRQMATETIRIGHGAGAGWGDRYSFANSHRARSDRRPACRDRWALLFAKADFLNGFSGPIFCSTLPAGDSIKLVVCNSRGPLRNSARQN